MCNALRENCRPRKYYGTDLRAETMNAEAPQTGRGVERGNAPTLLCLSYMTTFIMQVSYRRLACMLTISMQRSIWEKHRLLSLGD